MSLLQHSRASMAALGLLVSVGQVSAVLAAEAASLGPITVYGSRTAAALEDETASVGVVTREEIESRYLKSFRDAFRLLGNVQDSDFVDSGFIIRGVNSEGLTPGGAPLASFYVDGVRQTTQGTRRGARGLWDVEQLEVYRGPQSTLSGRAALAGAVYLKSRDPSFDWEAAAEGTLGSDDLRQGAFLIGGPLVDNQVAFRISGQYAFQESDLNYPTYERFERFDDFTEDKSYQLRGKILIEPEALESTSILASYSFSHDSPNIDDIGGPVLGFEFSEQRGDFNTPNFAEPREVDNHSAGLEVTHDVNANLTLTSHTGFARSNLNRSSINVGTPGETDVVVGREKEKLFTQELRLNYAGGPWSAVLGAYFEKDDATANFVRPDFFGFASDVSRNTQDSTNVAGFGEATYEFLPGWKVVGGLRVDHTQTDGAAFFSRNGDATTDFKFDLDETVLLPKGGLIRDLAPDHSLAFTVQRGFRSGGAGSQRSTGSVFSFDPEFTWTYEGSYRGSFMADKVQVNANLFYTDWTDQQVEVLDDPNDFTSARTVNAAASTVRGFELDLRVQPSREISGFISYGLSDTRFDDFRDNSVGNLTGSSFPEAPQTTVAIGGRYEAPSGFFIGADAKYTSRFMARIGQPPQEHLPSRVVANAQLGFEAKHWRITAFAENLFDKKYFTFADNDIAATLGDRRLIGVTAQVNY